MTVIVIRRGEGDASAEIFDYLTAYFNGDINGICKYINIRDDEDAMKGVEKMSGLGQSIYEKGVSQGFAQGEKNLAELIEKLISLGRTEDVSKAASDENARKAFYKEFGIID